MASRYAQSSRYPQYGGERSDVQDRVVSLNRVAKVVKGGRKFSFSALIVVGDGNGRVGAGLGKAREVPEAVRKGIEIAKRNMITVPMVGSTIPHEVRFKWGAAKIMLKPAAPGTGVISGGAMRAVIELAGIKDILTKSMGTNNPINTVRATMEALQSLRTAQNVAELRGKSVEDIVGRRLAAAYRQAAEKGTIEGDGQGTAAAAEAPAGEAPGSGEAPAAGRVRTARARAEATSEAPPAESTRSKAAEPPAAEPQAAEPTPTQPTATEPTAAEPQPEPEPEAEPKEPQAEGPKPDEPVSES